MYTLPVNFKCFFPCLTLFFFSFTEVNQTYYGEENSYVVGGQMTSPFLAYALATFVRELGNTITEAEACRSSEIPRNMDPIFSMTEKMSRKRRGEPRSGQYAEDAVERKRRKMADSGTLSCDDHNGECIFPPGRMCRGLNPTRERRDLFDRYVEHENAVELLEHQHMEEAAAILEEARLYREREEADNRDREEAAEILVELSAETVRDVLEDGEIDDDDDTVILGDFSPMSPDPNDDTTGNGRPIYTPNMAEYSPTPNNVRYNEREFALGGLTEEEVEDMSNM